MNSRISIFRMILFFAYLFGSVAGAQTTLQLNSAEQSSTAFSGAASRAIDGNTNGSYGNRSVTHTKTEQHPWWQASLESSELISEIVIHNRTDACCSDRLGKFFVFLSDQPFSADADRSYDLDNDPNVYRLTYVNKLAESSITIPVNRSAKYIRIQMGTLGTLSLAEVEVKGFDAPATELSLSDASQSSTRFSGVAARAIDTNTNGVWRNRSVTHTSNESEPWWQAKLASNTAISEVQLWNRTDDCCTFRLSDFYVFVSDTPFNANDIVSDLINNQDIGWSFHSGTLAQSNVRIPISHSGQYVRIQLSGVGTLSLAEVKVFGTVNNGTQPYRKTIDVTTYNNNGAWGGFDTEGFSWNGFTSLQSYPVELKNRDQNEDNNLIDGTDQFVSSPPIGDYAWRAWDVYMGLANGYLHIAASIFKSNSDSFSDLSGPLPPLLLDSPEQIWNDDSFEIYLNVGNERTAGYDENDFLQIYRFPEIAGSIPTTATGSNSQLDLTNSVICNREEYGATTCEAIFSLEELGLTGNDEVEIGFDIQFNFDDDGGDRDAKYSWCSGETVSAWRDMSTVDCSLRLVNDCETNCSGF